MSPSLSRYARLLGLSLGLAVSVGGGCFYPSYSFDGEAPGAGGATSASVTTTTGSVGGGGASTVSSSVTTSTGSSGGEDCLDGVDDDDDALIDCEDPDCQAGYSCVDAIPVGWGIYGYVALAQSVPGNEPACPPEYADTAFVFGGGALIADAATCAACDCDPPTGEVCTLPDQDPAKAGIQGAFVSTQVCGAGLACTGAETIPAAWPGTCAGGSVWLGSHQAACTANPCASSNCNRSVIVGSPIVQGGSCAATGGDAAVDPVGFAVSAKGCAGGQSGGGCGGTASCQANPPSGFEQKLCVAQAGDVACPGAFTVRTLLNDPAQTMDDRGCTPCTCSAPSGGACDLSVDVWGDATCTMLKVATLTGPTYCADLTNNPDVRAISATTLMPPTGSSCASVPGGGLPTGSAVAGGATTVCCLP